MSTAATTGQTATTTDFLTTIWPPEGKGFYCIATQVPGRKGLHHETFETIQAAHDYAMSQASTRNVFYNLATLLERDYQTIDLETGEYEKADSPRHGANASYHNCLFLDVDVEREREPSKPKQYKTREEALAAVESFRTELKLPEPIIASSGLGLHVYWVFKQSVDAATWSRIAAKWKAIAGHYRVCDDIGILADLARILRPVGTLNHKDSPPSKVEILKWSDARLNPVRAETNLDSAIAALGIAIAKPKTNDYAGNKEATADHKLILERCKQMGRVKDEGGTVGYQMRASFLSIGKCCKNPDFSALDNDPAPETVASQTANMLETSITDNPHTCLRVEGNNPGGCDGCEYKGKIKSPVVLGYSERQGTDETGGGNELPKNYKLTHSALFYVTPAKKDGEHPTEHRLSNHLVVKAVTRDTDGDNYGRYIEYKDTDGRLRHMSVPAETVHDPKELIKRLTNYGADISPNPFAKERLQQYLIDSKPSKRKTCVTRLGWVTGDIWEPGSGFALTDKTITAPGGEEIVYQGTGRAPISERGTLEQWKSEVGALCVNNTRLIISICASLAGTLLRPLGYDDNFGLHIFGDSSSGKTRSLVVACSIWGNPENLKGSWNTTLVGLEAMAADRNDMVVTLDEIKEANIDLGAAVMMLANGSGRARGDRNGDAKAIRTFKNTHISTGEYTIDEHIQRAGGTMQAGLTVRTLNIPIPGPHGAFEDIHGYPRGSEFATALSRATKLYHGTVGRVWLEQLVTSLANPANKKVITDRIDEFVNGLADADKHGQIQRVAQNFGLLYAAGQLAISWGLVDWDRSQVTNAVNTCFKDWLETRGGGEKSHEELSIVSQFRSFIFRNASRFQDGSTICDDSVKIPNRLGYVFKGHYYIRHTELGTICHELQLNGGADKAEKVLRDAKIIVSKERKINPKSGRLEVPAVDVGGFVRDNKRINFKQVRAHVLQFDEDVSSDAPAQGVAG